MRRGRGFSLIELTITVGIVGILAAIAVPAWSTLTARTRQLEARGGLETIHGLQNAFFAENNAFGSLSDIGFVPEGQSRYAFQISTEDRPGSVLLPTGVNVDVGGTGPSRFLVGSGGGGGGGSKTSPSPGDGSAPAPTSWGNPHFSAESFEAVAIGQISQAPAPNDLDVWAVDHTGWLENLNVGY